MKAMLLAAGLGTRLKPFTDTHPKALARVNGKTLLEHNLRYLQRFGINEVIVNVHHFADQIEEELRANDGFGSLVTVSDERKEVLETGGGLYKARWFFKEEPDFVLMNVDVMTNLDLGKMMVEHRQLHPMATLAVMQRTSSRKLLFDAAMNLCGWQHMQTGEQRIARQVEVMNPYAFTGIQILTKSLLEGMNREGKFSLIDVYLEAAANHILKGYDHTGDLFIDVGKPESLARAGVLFST